MQRMVTFGSPVLMAKSSPITAVTTRQTTLNEGVNAALRAVQLDDKNPYCHYAVAITHTFAGQFDAATEAAQRSVALCPSFALGYFGLSHARVFAGQPKEAIEALEHGLRLNPFDPQGFAWHLTSAISYFFVGRPEKGLDHARRALSLRPHWAPALMLVTLCAAELGDIPRARAALKEMDTTGDARVGVLGEVLTYNPRWDDHVRQTMAAVRADLVETSAARMSE